MGEVALGRRTQAQALTNLNALLTTRPDGTPMPGGTPLTAAEQTSAQTLLTSITSITGSGAATAKVIRSLEIDRVLILARAGAPDYNTPTKIQAILGF
jgi:hypothetical protein